MTSLHEVRARTAPDRAAERSTHEEPSDRDRRRSRKWLWGVAAAVVAALLVGGGVWRLADSTVPASDYDDLVAELDAAEEALARSRAALARERSLRTELTGELNEELTAATDELQGLTETLGEDEVQLRARFATAEPAALLLGYFAGADRDIGGRRWDRSWSGVVTRDMAVEALDDPMLTEAYWEHLDGDVGDPFPEFAENEFMLRLIELTVEPILEGG